MTISPVNGIYEQYQSGKITLEKATNLLLEELYKSSYYFGISKKNEEIFCGFFVWIHQHIPSVILKFNNTRCSFLTYFTAVMRLYFKDWMRHCLKRQTTRDIVDTYFQENQTYTTDIFCAEPKPEYEAKRHIIFHTPLTALQKKTILILALKSFQFMNHEQLDLIPCLTGISSECFYAYINQLNLITEKNKKNFNKFCEQLNTSYITCKRCIAEMENLDSKQSQYYYLSQKLAKHQKRLELKQQLYEQHRQRCIPKNAAIEQVLHLSKGSVKRILRTAELRIQKIQQSLTIIN